MHNHMWIQYKCDANMWRNIRIYMCRPVKLTNTTIINNPISRRDISQTYHAMSHSHDPTYGFIKNKTYILNRKTDQHANTSRRFCGRINANMMSLQSDMSSTSGVPKLNACHANRHCIHKMYQQEHQCYHIHHFKINTFLTGRGERGGCPGTRGRGVQGRAGWVSRVERAGCPSSRCERAGCTGSRCERAKCPGVSGKGVQGWACGASRGGRAGCPGSE